MAIVPVKVSSSNISMIGYDEQTAMLTVSFNNGTTYAYSDVPEGVYQAFLASDSKGKYFHNNIKNSYSFDRIG